MKWIKAVINITTLLVAFAAGLAAQNLSVSGKVVSKSDGTPLAYATIQVKNTANAVIASDDGSFEITVPGAGSILVVSYVGMKEMEVPVLQSGNLTIEMEESTALSEVVVTALGIKRSEKALGYSVQKISGGSLQKVSGVDVATSLTGKVAGLLVRNSTDFAALPVITIRGERPLIVIDGVAYQNKTLSDFSSADIESISVLKGATASALYGFRGANGAILITTKNGSNDASGLSVEFTSNNMFSAGFLAIPEKQSVYGRGTNNAYNINSDQSWGAVMDGKDQTQWDPFEKVFKSMPYVAKGKDNFANFLEQGYASNNNLNVTFNRGNSSFRNSFNWTQNKGQYPNSLLDKFTYSLGADMKLDKFKIGSNLSYAKKKSPNVGSNGYTSYDPMYSLLIWSSADFNILDYKDNYWITKGEQQNYIFGLQPNGSYTGANQNNPYFDRYERTNEINRDIFNADITAEYEITSWLRAILRSGLDFYKEAGQLRVSKGSYLSTGNTGIPGNSSTWNGGNFGAYLFGQTSGYSINSDVLMTGSFSLKDFNFEYLTGGTIFFNRDENINAQTNGGITIPGYFSLKASVNSPVVNQSLVRRQVNSLFGRLAISWKGLVYLEATGRNDWSSTLSKEERSYFYPSLSGSFVASELLPSTRNWLDILKLRGSYTVSKAIPGVYEVNPSYALANNTWRTFSGAAIPTNLYPSNITPAAANTYEVGLQSIILRNRAMFDISYYDKKIYNGIITGPISNAAGWAGVYTNTKEVTNRRGWEVVLNGKPINRKDLQLDVSLNWSTYKRIYTVLDSIYSAKRPWVKVGERVDVLFSRDFVRNPATGELVFNNGRLVYSSYDSKFGYTDPDWIWGSNATLSYKNLSLFLSFDGVSGGLMNTRTESYMWQSGNHPNSVTPERALDVATPGSTNFLGKGVKVVAGTATYDAFGNITSDTREYAPNDKYTTYKQYAIDLHNSSAWGGNGSPSDTYSKTFFKLREISITYQIPSRVLGKVAKAASLSFIGQNVFLKAKDFKYSDPDGGSEDFADPSVRFLGFNFKVTL
jgi:TonB-linked SusC/RagA family outer membrane protein